MAMKLPDKLKSTQLWMEIQLKLHCWPMKVAVADAAPGSKMVTLKLTKAGWVLGSYDDLRAVVTGCAMTGLWDSPLRKAWQKLNQERSANKEMPRPLRFGRRGGDVILPPAQSFSGKSDWSGDMNQRTASESSHLRKKSEDPAFAFQHARPINRVTDRELEYDAALAKSYAGRTVEAHHVFEDNLCNKLDLPQKDTIFSKPVAVTVALNPEFHQRYFRLKQEERRSFSARTVTPAVLKELITIYDDLYKDTSVAELHTVARLIISTIAGLP